MNATGLTTGKDTCYPLNAILGGVMEQLPSPPWKLLMALSRFASLRVPSEALALRWHMVNWEKKQITAPVPKLAHISGKAMRVIPIFAELSRPATGCL